MNGEPGESRDFYWNNISPDVIAKQRTHPIGFLMAVGEESGGNGMINCPAPITRPGKPKSTTIQRDRLANAFMQESALT